MQLSNHKMKRVLFVLLIVSMMIFATQPFAASAQSFVGATSADGGVSTATATTIGGVISSATAASIGNGSAFGLAFTPVSAAGAGVTTTGPAAAYATGFGIPGFSNAEVWTATLPGGTASGSAFAMP